MSILKLVKRKIASSREIDEALHSAALDEFNSGLRRKGLWARALIEGEGDAGRTDSVYLRLLVESFSRETAELPQAGLEGGFSSDEAQDLRFSSPQWYYTAGGSQHGPIYLHELNALIRQRYLGLDDKVFGPGVITWRKVRDFA